MSKYIRGLREHPHLINGLKDFIKDIPNNASILVEIGSYQGESANIFASSGKFNEIHCVDPWNTSHWGSKSNNRDYDIHHAEACFDKVASKYKNLIFKHKMTGNKAVDMFGDGSVCVVYIDAVHTYEAVKNDIEKWLPKVRKGGVISGHDYHHSHPGVEKAVLEVLGKPSRVYQDTSWLIYF